MIGLIGSAEVATFEVRLQIQCSNNVSSLGFKLDQGLFSAEYAANLR
jgi:hypothetical protein